MNSIVRESKQTRTVFIESSIDWLLRQRETCEINSRLIRTAITAYDFRDPTSLSALGRHLVDSRSREAQGAGAYFSALSHLIDGKLPLEDITTLLKFGVEYSPTILRGRCLLSLAAVEADKGNEAQELSLYDAAIRIGDAWAVAENTRMIAVNASKHGAHSDAISMLQSLWPVVRAAAQESPSIYGHWQNSLAYELFLIGETKEAVARSDSVLSLSCASRYPGWKETREEIAASDDNKGKLLIFVPQRDPFDSELEERVSLSQMAMDLSVPSSVVHEMYLLGMSRSGRSKAPKK
jgi:hypothetical protein